MKNILEKKLAIPDSAIDRYEILSPLDPGEKVFLVRDRQTREIFVEKIVSVHNPSLYRQLIDHPQKGIPKIFSMEFVNGKMILIEEYIHGLDLMQMVRNKGLAPEETVVNWMLQLCDILDRLHRMTPPLIHRDIKPSNIILDNYSNIYLIDFNISRRYNTEASLDTVPMVSHHFSAPESYGFGQTDPRSDIYSIGATMHFLLTGGCLNETVYMGPLEDIIRRCTMMDPKNRYQSIEDLKRALGHHISSQCKRLLPPGFRTGKAVNMVIAVLGYCLIANLCFSMKVKSTFSEPIATIDRWMERTIVFLFFIESVLVLFDYRGCQGWFPGIGKMQSRLWKTILSIGILLFIAVAAIAVFSSLLSLL